jgi:hypothetical protein
MQKIAIRNKTTGKVYFLSQKNLDKRMQDPKFGYAFEVMKEPKPPAEIKNVRAKKSPESDNDTNNDGQPVIQDIGQDQ